nr:hypothetical protein [Paenibacillus sp. PL91]
MKQTGIVQGKGDNKFAPNTFWGASDSFHLCSSDLNFNIDMCFLFLKSRGWIKPIKDKSKFGQISLNVSTGSEEIKVAGSTDDLDFFVSVV